MFGKKEVPVVNSVNVTLYTCRGCPGIPSMTEAEMIKHTRLLPAHQALVSAEVARQDVVTTTIEKTAVGHLGSLIGRGIKALDNATSEPPKKKRR